MITTREAKRDEVAPTLAVWREAFRAGRPGYFIPPETETRLFEEIDTGHTFVVLACDGSSVVGMAVASQALEKDGLGAPIPGLCHIGVVAVSPSRWGEGVGGLLVKTTLGSARARGYRRAQLWTRVDNQRGRRLYEREGFRPSGRTKIEDNQEIMHLERPTLT